jgi:tetratricopeptide (TPR) repeat protein
MNRIGGNLHILLASAVLHLRQGENEKALVQYNKVLSILCFCCGEVITRILNMNFPDHFAQIRQIDRRFVVDMDGLAWLLLKRGDMASLLTVSTDLMKAAPTRHEGWAASAAYYHLKSAHEMAQECIARASALGPLSPFSWLIRGEITILSTHTSAISFRTSWVLLRSFPAAEGLINALFVREELQKSLIVANDVMKVAGPNSARAWALHGRVAMKDPKTRDQAQKDLEKALQIDENCLHAVVSLADVFVAKKDLIKAQQMFVFSVPE